jgi:hypothetical protein
MPTLGLRGARSFKKDDLRIDLSENESMLKAAAYNPRFFQELGMNR